MSYRADENYFENGRIIYDPSKGGSNRQLRSLERCVWRILRVFYGGGFELSTESWLLSIEVFDIQCKYSSLLNEIEVVYLLRFDLLCKI